MTPLPDRSAEWNANPCKPRRKHDPATRYQRRWEQEKKRNHRRPRPEIPEAEIIIAEVAAKHGFNAFALQQQRRKPIPLARAKREACVRLRSELNLSYPTIAALLGWVNHSTAILAVREGRSATNPKQDRQRGELELYTFDEPKGECPMSDTPKLSEIRERDVSTPFISLLVQQDRRHLIALLDRCREFLEFVEGEDGMIQSLGDAREDALYTLLAELKE